MTDTPAHLVERLSSEGEKIASTLSSLSPEQWEQALYTDGACWTVRQVLAHFVASERGFYSLISDILAGGSGAPEDFRLNEYNERKVDELAGASPAELLSLYTAQRQKTCELVSGMCPEDLLRTGRHPFLGVAPVEDMLKLIYRHNQIHLRDIRRLLKEDG